MLNITPPSPRQMAEYVLSTFESMGKNSLPEYTASTRLTPSVLVDKALTLYDDTILSNILQTMLSIYSAHYLQAVRGKMSVNGVETLRILDQFSTNRDLSAGRLAGEYGSNVLKMVTTEALLEDYAKQDPEVTMEGRQENDLQDRVNLAIGRILNVKLGVGDESITMPVSVVMQPRVIESASLPRVLAMLGKDTSFMGRTQQFRVGEIDSFVDYVFGLDIIEADRKALLNDDTGIYAEARRKKRKSKLATILTGKQSLNMASTMAVISSTTAEELELALRGRLNDPRVRMKYFEDTYSMMLVVVNRKRELLTVFQRGIDDFGEYSFMDIEDHGSKAGSMDIGSILKAYKLGEAPSL